jgi:F420H(2)-dependent quinone reductase
MRTIRNAAVVLLFLVLACAPADRRPGMWLRGERVHDPVADWTFSDAFPQIAVETRTWYLLPHSVTTVCATHDGHLYVPSIYGNDAPFPEERFWNRNVARDPRVRVKVGERVYDRDAVLVTDPREREAVLRAFAVKYAFWRELTAKPETERGTIVLLRMDDPRS